MFLLLNLMKLDLFKLTQTSSYFFLFFTQKTIQKLSVFFNADWFDYLYINIKQIMNIEQAKQQPSVIYFTVLIVLEALIFIFMIVANEKGLIMFNILRIILLIGAHCLKTMAWAAYYTVFAFIAALYIFDPVGLWITGHGDAKTKVQNGFAVVAFVSTIVAVILGYFYKVNLQKEVEQDFSGDAVPAGYSNPNENNKFLYREGANRNAQEQPRQFNQFSGQAYSLGD